MHDDAGLSGTAREGSWDDTDVTVGWGRCDRHRVSGERKEEG